MSCRRTALILALLALSGCDRSGSAKVDPRPVAVQPGSVSDAMLETGQLQAQAPIAEPTASGVPGEDDEPAGRERPRRPAAAPKAAAGGAAETPAEPRASPTAAATPAPAATAAAAPRPSPSPTRSPGPR